MAGDERVRAVLRGQPCGQHGELVVKAIAKFARAYADQNEADYALFMHSLSEDDLGL